MKLWDKGLSIDKKIEHFTVGNDREIDIHIAPYDLQASLAHAKMLASIGIITSEELAQVTAGITTLQQQVAEGTFIIDAQFEDVHSKIEFELTNMCGEVGKKNHTARSRNDQVLVALQLYYKDNLQLISDKTKTLFNTLLQLAEEHKTKLLPGYTHLQVAMPSSFGLWFSAYAELLIDDLYMVNAALKTVDQNPLGSAAGYGSSFPIDREFTTKELGFETLKYNAVAAQMSRGKSERTLTMALGSVSNTLARFAMDICLYMSQNFDFISFPDELTTGSSIMPHKKNPDVFELIRGKCNKIQALYTETLLITNNLPSGYHRDYQLLKENIINAFEELKDVLDIFDYAIQQVIVKDIDLQDEKYKYLFTVDNMNTLVENGMSFREAYQKIGDEVVNGTYTPDTSKKHTHVGSIDNLCLDKIREKLG
ncbi:argininosuccinate lyase [Tenacibaculum mesophilum]|uniref:Argininosuccinate lyase n=1 Tax=Tenacibaculum mesophilum TaxID=104268 RepID=A0ABM7CCM8_9FLAO|nr:argininosuccinate lyase [Tenacibaculum mesophilum]AZJ31472.1 argininosuccinate lyase [Tenacibaculum mesophilum]QFS29521.1 argininosuccinate lyase [Tenacibaculum mesophilum]SHF95190.1 argininosuccinate lyase [Tenacibaculum mesophilum]